MTPRDLADEPRYSIWWGQRGQWTTVSLHRDEQCVHAMDVRNVEFTAWRRDNGIRPMRRIEEPNLKNRRGCGAATLSQDTAFAFRMRFT